MHRFALDPKDLSPETALTFPGPAGDLQGLYRPVRPGAEPHGVVVVAHPHPGQGGTMRNKVVFHVARVLNHDLDLASLRFNFRGVERSDGSHDGGRGEVQDLLAAFREARRQMPRGVLVAAGFSFGAAMTLKAVATSGPDDPQPDALALVGVPMRLYDPPSPFPKPIPLVTVHGSEDTFTPPEEVGAYLESWPGPHASLVIPDADHFLEGHLPFATRFLVRQLRDWLG